MAATSTTSTEKNEWMFRGVVHDSWFHGAVDRSSVPGRFGGRDGSLHRGKEVHVLAGKLPRKLLARCAKRKSIITSPSPALTRRARKLQQVRGNQYSCQAPMKSVENLPRISCMDFHHQNEQADGRSRKTYTNQVHICCELRLLNYVSTEK